MPRCLIPNPGRYDAVSAVQLLVLQKIDSPVLLKKFSLSHADNYLYLVTLLEKIPTNG
jgi:hypothetical protein